MSFASAGDSLLPAGRRAPAAHPAGAHVATTIGETEQAYELLRSNQIEVAVVLEPFGRGDEPHDDLLRVHLLDDPYRAMLPEGHPLTDQDTVELTELAHEDWVAAMGGNGFCRDDTIDLCRRAGFTPRFVAHAVEFPAAQAYVAAGIGVGLVPVLALGAVHRGVAIRRLRREPEPRHVWVVTRQTIAGDGDGRRDRAGACASPPASTRRARPGTSPRTTRTCCRRRPGAGRQARPSGAVDPGVPRSCRG